MVVGLAGAISPVFFWAEAATDLAAQAVPTTPQAMVVEHAPATPATPIALTPAQLFELADARQGAGDFAAAASFYRALATNPNPDLRIEARFRLAMMLADKQHQLSEAATQLRLILDEKPRAARVRLELARIQAMRGNTSAAARELRAAEASGLPPEVEQNVRFYAQAIDAKRHTGGSLELALAPDSNVNRATRASSLGTVLGDFTLDQNARAHSGLGLALRGQGFGRIALSPRVALLARLSGSASLYRDTAFNDVAISPQIGPVIALGRDRLTLSAGPAWRWFGTEPYSFALSGSANYLHPIGRRSQLRLDASLGQVTYRFNRLQNGKALSLAAGLDRAFTPRFGGGLQLVGNRQSAADPGYATASIGANGYLFREMGKTTLSLAASYSHLAADERLQIFPRQRIDNFYALSLAGNFRGFRLGSLAPLARIRYERNQSTVGLYDFNRLSGELGITTAF